MTDLPSYKLVQRLMHESGFPVADPNDEMAFPQAKFMKLASRLIQYGADQELEACCEWIESELRGQLRPAQRIADDLRAARRPKPPSLKEQALAAANLLFSDSETGTCAAARNTIRRALEALPNE
jgi:hypothetical protein